MKSANATKTGWLLPQEPVQTAAFPLDASRVISDLKSSHPARQACDSQIRQDKLAIEVLDPGLFVGRRSVSADQIQVVLLLQ